MQSDFNHIDEFFRRKDQDVNVDHEQQDKHWQQMKDLLVVPGSPTVTIRTINTGYWQAATGVLILAVSAFLLFRQTANTAASGDHSRAQEPLVDSVIPLINTPLVFKRPAVIQINNQPLQNH